MATAAEITVICVDTSSYLRFDHPFIKAQVEAIKKYCHIKLQCNPENRVGIYRMASHYDGFELSPTNNLEQILDYVEGLPRLWGGAVQFPRVLENVSAFRRWMPSNMKRSLLVFVASPINLYPEDVRPLGLMLRKMDIALTVVNFFALEEDMLQMYDRVLHEKFQHGKEELAELVTLVNVKDNSHMVDADVGEASVFDLLSKSMLKKNIRYLRKKAEKKPNKNVNVKQELEPSGSEENKAAAEYGKQLPYSRPIGTKVSWPVPKKKNGLPKNVSQKG